MTFCFVSIVKMTDDSLQVMYCPRWMRIFLFNDNDDQMLAKFLDICLTVEETLRKNLSQEIDPTRNGTWACCMRGNDIIS